MPIKLQKQMEAKFGPLAGVCQSLKIAWPWKSLLCAFDSAFKPPEITPFIWCQDLPSNCQVPRSLHAWDTSAQRLQFSKFFKWALSSLLLRPSQPLLSTAGDAEFWCSWVGCVGCGEEHARSQEQVRAQKSWSPISTASSSRAPTFR